MDGGQRVWAPHPVEGYQLGEIADVGADTLTVEPLNKNEQVCWQLVYYSVCMLGIYCPVSPHSSASERAYVLSSCAAAHFNSWDSVRTANAIHTLMFNTSTRDTF